MSTHRSVSLSERSSSLSSACAFHLLYLSISSTRHDVFLAFRMNLCFSSSFALGLCVVEGDGGKGEKGRGGRGRWRKRGEGGEGVDEREGTKQIGIKREKKREGRRERGK